jgi:hypothetical protein
MRGRSLRALVFLPAVAMLIAVAPPAEASGDQVVVHPGDVVQIAVVLDHSDGLADSGASSRNAIQQALEAHPVIRGFPVSLNDFDGPCRNPAVAAEVASEVVANTQNAAVIGHMCSPDEHAALPIYEAAGVVTISGSATGPLNPGFGPDVFNSTAVPDDTPGEGDSWYARVQQLPRDVTWHTRYAARFGSTPAIFADLYFDAATVLLDALEASSTLEGGDLVIDRVALATAVRQVAGRAPQGTNGVTCWIKLDARGYRINDPAALDRCGRLAP